MRSEDEVRRMIEEIRAMRPWFFVTGDNYSANRQLIADGMIAVLENVLNGPKKGGWCACSGPAGFCHCEIMSIGG